MSGKRHFISNSPFLRERKLVENLKITDDRQVEPTDITSLGRNSTASFDIINDHADDLQSIHSDYSATTGCVDHKKCIKFLTPYRTAIIKNRIKSNDDYVRNLKKVNELDVIFGHFYFVLLRDSNNPQRGQVFQYDESNMMYAVLLNDEGKFAEVSIDGLREIPENTAKLIGRPVMSCNTVPQCGCFKCVTMNGITKAN